MSAEAHHAAVVAALQADAQLAAAVFEIGEVPDPAPERYIVHVSSLGDWEQRRFTGVKAGLVTTHTLYCVGASAKHARWLAGRVTTQLKDQRLTVTGRYAFLPSPWISRPVQIDRDGLFPLPFGVIQFDLLSEPV